MNLNLNSIKEFAIRVHKDQTRDDGSPYWLHLQRVFDILIRNNISDPDTLAVAWLHDTVEDADITFHDLLKISNDNVVELVAQLTNKHPKGTSREIKQQGLIDHAKSMSSSAKLIKLADRLDNITSMQGVWDSARQLRYIKETRELLFALKPVPNLAMQIYNEILSICAGYDQQKKQLSESCCA